MHLICSDLEGIFLPEIWITFAEKTGIQELRLTTRDIPDYDALMKRRLNLLKEHRLKLPDIQAVIATMDPHEGALEFLSWIRPVAQILVVSDTFVEFAGPLMQKLGYGKSYKYAHNYPGHIVEQEHLPTELKDRKYYAPSDSGYERQIQERLKSWQEKKLASSDPDKS